ncbi:MAG: MATE family efflux transporter [Ruminococcaceae bacterium]|nr:MATE family efflux transporter [Oscillospiraceae bacterium]
MSENVKAPENKMGVQPVGKLILSMSVPMMISMLVLALYNIVDSIFVSMISENALTAVSLAFPIQNLMIAVSTGTGVGINAFVSKYLGAKEYEKANSIANNGIYLAIFSYIGFALFCGFFGGPLIRAMAGEGENAEIIAYGTEYIRIVGLMSFGLFIQMVMERLIQSTGKTLYSMITQITGAVINIILDPIFIFTFDLGVVGAALATVLGQILACGLAIWFNLKKNPELTISLKKYRLSGKAVRDIYSVGIPSIVMGSIGSLMTFGMNRILMGFTSTAAAVFGVYFKVQSFVFMPVFGLNNGIVPIIAYNYGARKRSRIMETMKLGLTYAGIIMLVGTVVFQIFPELLLSMFNPTPAMLEIGVPALRIISLSFICAAVGIVFTSVFQALGNGMLSLIASIIRQLVVLLPAAYILSSLWGLSAIWWSFLIAEVVCILVLSVFMRNLYNKKIKTIEE